MATSKKTLSSHRKLALIISNENYSQSYNRLKNSINNANDLCKTLKTIGFDVTKAHDLTNKEMIESVIDFSKKINNGDLIFFYFCGHGYQVEGENYLIPIDDTCIKTERNCNDFAVNFKRTVVDRFTEKNSSYANIFILDCSSPYLLSSKAESSSTIGNNSLREIKPPPTSAFIQFACAASRSVSDQLETDRHTLFSECLLKCIAKENVHVADIFVCIANDVYQKSNQQLKPISMNGLIQGGNIYLHKVVGPDKDADWNEKTEGSLQEIKEKQSRLKVYYDNFPSIEEAMNGTGADMKEAEELTKSILNKKPSGDVTERSTACHVLAKLFDNQSQQCIFFDSTHGKNLRDGSRNLSDINSEDRPLVLKLSSSEGLGKSKSPKTEHGAIRQIQSLNDAIVKNKSDPVIDEIVDGLSKAHNVDKTDIFIKYFYVGSFNAVYTVKNLAKRAVKLLMDVTSKLKDQFKQFLSAKIHPLLFRPSFDISYFHERGNKTFTASSDTYEIGPPECKMKYVPPTGWTRYGLNVLNRYNDGNSWLEPFQDPKNWYRAYHGTGRATKDDFGTVDGVFDKQYASVDAIASIYEKGFRTARVTAYGAGVYCSPNPTFPPQGYVSTVELETEQGKKKFQCMLQVAVNPNDVKFVSNDIWVVSEPRNIRPYGVLIKEV